MGTKKIGINSPARLFVDTTTTKIYDLYLPLEKWKEIEKLVDSNHLTVALRFEGEDGTANELLTDLYNNVERKLSHAIQPPTEVHGQTQFGANIEAFFEVNEARDQLRRIMRGLGFKENF